MFSFVPILPGHPKSDKEIEGLLSAADPRDVSHLLSLLLCSDQTEIDPFLVDAPDVSCGGLRALLADLGFQEVIVMNSTKLKYTYDKVVAYL